MTTTINNKFFSVKQTGNKFFYWSPKVGRYLPIAKAKVNF